MAGPQGYRDIPEEDRRKAKVFFDRAAAVAATGQVDYAIEMYIQGLAFDPEAVDAHQAMREISLKRKAGGGKPLGMMDKFKLKKGDDKQKMLNAEKLLAYDPGNTDHMLAMMDPAATLGYYDSVMWIGPIALRANLEGKREQSKFTKLKEIYIRMRVWDRATEAAQHALAMSPTDMDAQKEVKDLAARQTMSEGNYEGGGGFQGSIRDREGQEKLMRKDSDVRTEDQMSSLIREAEQEWQADPDEAGKIGKLVDILVKTENPEHENRAIDLLENAYKRTKQYRFRLRVGEIRMRQLGRMDRSMREQLTRNPKDAALAHDYKQFRKEKLETELSEFTLAAENYPTQIEYKYHMAVRMFELGMFGEAIPLFQEGRQDPKLKVDASVMLGRSFLEAGFMDEAVDTLKQSIDEYQLKGDPKSIAMTYWYARSLEAKDDKPAASKAYSQVAQWNFNYADVQARIKSLRSKM